MDARFFARGDLRRIAVHPEILRDQFWQDLKAAHPVTKYLGIEKMHHE